MIQVERKVFALFAVLFCFAGCDSNRLNLSSENLPEPQSVTLKFQIKDDLGNPLAGAEIEQGDTAPVITDHEGKGIVHAAQSPLYQVKISEPGYYSIVHTFSDIEREQLGGNFPAIRLVEKKPGRVMLAFTGDAMLGRRYYEPYQDEPQHLHEESVLEDTKALLTPIKPYLEQADYVSVNLESPVLLTEPEERSPKNIVFFSRPETLDALSWASVDHVSLGNNHTADYLDLGLRQTLDYLEKSGLAFSGAGMTETEALKAAGVEVNQVPYSILGYVGWPGTVVPSQVAEGDNQSGAALGNVENIVNSVAAQPKDSTVIVEYHGSSEYSEAPTEQTVERLHAAINAGADLAIGHHPHVLHGFELYNNKLIAYSLGNFLFDQYIYETQRSAMLYVWMDQDRFYTAEAVPLYINNYRPTPAVGAIRDYSLRRLKRQSVAGELRLSHSGGHLTISHNEIKDSSEVSEIAITPNQLSRPLIWNQQTQALRLTRNVSYRMGRDLWAYGDFETEDHYGLKAHNWNFSHSDSGISDDQAIDRFSMRLLKYEGEFSTSAVQKYFLRVWDDKPKSVSVSAYTDSPAEIELCLEMRGPDTSTADARLNPEVHCLDRRQLHADGWHQTVFDFTPPPQDYRGLRFRFSFYGDSDQAKTFYIDQIQFVSWDEEGTVASPEALLPIAANQSNIFEFRNTENPDCCVLVYSHEP